MDTEKGKRGRVGVVLLVVAIAVTVALMFVPAGTSVISGPQAAVLGAIEGLTEYLPVSSTGHLILASHAMGMSKFGAQSGVLGREVIKDPAVSAFEVVIQFGAILAVVGLYRTRVSQMVRGLAGRHAEGLRLVKLLLIGTAPALVVGPVLHKPIQQNLFGPLTVSAALVVGGVIMIVLDALFRRRDETTGTSIEQMAYWQALVIGVVQVTAMWPGTSRSMVTILAALAVGLRRVSAAEFSFLLALPTLGAATVYEAVGSFGDMLGAIGPAAMIVGMVTSGLVAAVAVKLFVKWLTKHGLIPFGVYRILLGAAVLWYFRQDLLG